MASFVTIITTLTPIGISICGLLGLGSVGRIILKNMEYKNDEKIRKEKKLTAVDSNFDFYNKLFDRICLNIKILQNEHVKNNVAHNDSQLTFNEIDAILGSSVINLNIENNYLDIEDQASLKHPLQTRGLY